MCSTPEGSKPRRYEKEPSVRLSCHFNRSLFHLDHWMFMTRIENRRKSVQTLASSSVSEQSGL